MGDRSRPAVCQTIDATTMAELRHARDEGVGADLIEIRLDTVRDPDAAGALAGRKRPVLVTCRASWEGGRFDGSEDERMRLLNEAWDLGAEYVDIERSAPGSAGFLERTGGRRVVLSFHDFDGVPHDVHERFRALSATSAEVVKLAVFAHRVSDTLPLFALDREAGKRAFVALAMGPAGLPTRVLSARLGSRWCYAGSAAPGQLPLSRLLEEYRFRAVEADTPIYGVVGNPVMHSLSPAMHNAAFAATRVGGVYVPIEASDAGDFQAFADGVNLRGASVTAPFKLALTAGARVDEQAQRIGAINTLRRRDGAWEATNTDPEGFLAPLEATMPLEGVRAAVLGAGGAARAVAAALRSRGVAVVVHARRRDRAEALAQDLDAGAADWPPARGSWDVLVNTTPVGTSPQVDESPWPGGVFDGRMVYDLVYNPPVTRLLRDAKHQGCGTLGGLEMLVEQARRQFEWWTGVRPDADIMRDAALRRLDADGHAPRGVERAPHVEAPLGSTASSGS